MYCKVVLQFMDIYIPYIHSPVLVDTWVIPILLHFATDLSIISCKAAMGLVLKSWRRSSPSIWEWWAWSHPVAVAPYLAISKKRAN